MRPPLRSAPGAEMVRALVRHYTEERTPPGPAAVAVGFFHGGLPGDALLDACSGLPVRVSCSPADLDRAGLERLRSRGLERVELEALTLDSGVLRRLERGYRPGRVLQMIRALRETGLEVGVVLSPGLPGSTHSGALADAERLLDEAAPDLVRIHPALALEGAGVAAWVRDGRWSPMRLSEAVTTSAALLDRFQRSQVQVIRVGQQPGHDFPERVVAGPVHPGLRGLVEARRFRRRMHAALLAHPRNRPAVLRVHPGDLGWAKGSANANVKALRVGLGLSLLSVEPDPAIPRGHVHLGSPATGG